MFDKILIANRGEIAVRLIRACREMGIRTVAICSEADREALHTGMAEECFCIGGPRLKDSYLNQEAILTVAKRTQAAAIHPGVGLLSENPKFAAYCKESGISFIGPDSEIMEKMSHKDTARGIAKKLGIPIPRGSELISSYQEAKREAACCGYPILLKARAGGGGKGIRLVEHEEDLEHAFHSVKKEAENAFGDGELYLEQYIIGAKHIEVQILADALGQVLVLGDRDCSVQRKHQKLMEECPAPLVDQKIRKALHAGAKKMAEEVGYTTAGTIEFLVKGEEYYFLEMNTRLQVEHTITEMVTGIDLVKWQIRTAAGLPLTIRQEEIPQLGHAMECRICAEDPKTARPGCGKVEFLHIPGGPQVRFDTGLFQGYQIPPFYDSMIAKLSVMAQDREEMMRKLRSALNEMVLEGIVHNRNLFLELTEQREMKEGTYTTELFKERE